MKHIVVDVESDGPCPGLYSMVSIGAVVVEPVLGQTFYGQLRPISNNFVKEALDVSGTTRIEHMGYPDPVMIMQEFDEWIKEVAGEGRATLWSDNPAFDWQWINYYFHRFQGHNPFGFSARRIGDVYCGLMKDSRKNSDWKRKYRKTKHTHNPVDDARGNAEALLAFRDKLGFKVEWE